MPPSRSRRSSRPSASSAPITGTTDPDSRSPGTSVMKKIRSASSATAIAAAASSALTFSGPRAIGATTGIRPSSIASSTAGSGAGTGSPTSPSDGTCVAVRPISSPIRPTALGPSASQSCSLTARSDSRTTSSASAEVTRRPPTHCTGSPRASISVEICGPAPCTTHTQLPSSTRSRTCSAAYGATAPPSFTTERVTFGTPR
jgi:hypothetical protein